MNQILRKCYATAVILPSIIGFIAISIYTIITNIAYTGEWLTNEGFLSFVIVFSIVYCVIIYIFALPIFLNLFDYVRQNILLKLCSWFLLPFGFIALVMIHECTFTSDFIPVILINTPFVCGLIFSFLKFQKSIKSL